MSTYQDIERRTHRVGAFALVAVAITYLLVELILLGLHWGISYDESVYLSHLNPYTPTINWHAWRALGVAVLFTPVTLFDPGVVGVRTYADALSTALLVVAFWPWLRVLRPAVVVLAAVLYASCWISIYFGNDVQPNMYVGLAAVAVVGWFTRGLVGSTPSRRAVIGVAVAGFWLALLRPSDSLFVVAPLVALCVLQLPVRRIRLLLAVGSGVVLGWLVWIVEAFALFGNPVHRYQLANGADAVGGFHLGLRTAGIYLRLIDGHYYGFPRRESALGPIRSGWLALVVVAAVLVVVGLATGRDRSERLALSVVTASAVSIGFFYVFLLPYGASRFLLPVIALLAFPAAQALVWLTHDGRRVQGVVGSAVAIALVATYVAMQLTTAARLVRADRLGRSYPVQMAAQLRQSGVHKPCFIIGTVDIGAVSYWSHCQTGGPDPDIETAVGKARTRGFRPVVITTARRLSSAFDGWRMLTFTVANGRYHAWLAPEFFGQGAS